MTVPKMLGVPAAYFHGSALYPTRSGRTCPSAIMSPPYKNGSEDSKRCRLPYSTPVPKGASILWNENARKSTSSACTSVNDPGTSCAPSASRYDRRSPVGWRYPLAPAIARTLSSGTRVPKKFDAPVTHTSLVRASTSDAR
jgi:hypothetical protein